MTKKVQSNFLFAQPSFASGAARAADLWGMFDEYNGSESVAEADQIAVAADWAMVGQDLSRAIDEFRGQLASV